MSKSNPNPKKYNLRLIVFENTNSISKIIKTMDSLYHSVQMLSSAVIQCTAAIKLLNEKGVISYDEINEEIKKTVKQNTDSRNLEGSSIQSEASSPINDDINRNSSEESSISKREDNGRIKDART